MTDKTISADEALASIGVTLNPPADIDVEVITGAVMWRSKEHGLNGSEPVTIAADRPLTLSEQYKAACMALEDANEFGSPIEVEKAQREVNRLWSAMKRGPRR